MLSRQQGENMGIAALILGILGVVLSWIPLVGWVGVVLALVAIVLGFLTLKKGGKGLGIAALILGVVGLGWGLYVQIQTLMFASDLEGAFDDPALQMQMNQAMQQGLNEALQQAAEPVQPTQ